MRLGRGCSSRLFLFLRPAPYFVSCFLHDACYLSPCSSPFHALPCRTSQTHKRWRALASGAHFLATGEVLVLSSAGLFSTGASGGAEAASTSIWPTVREGFWRDVPSGPYYTTTPPPHPHGIQKHHADQAHDQPHAARRACCPQKTLQPRPHAARFFLCQGSPPDTARGMPSFLCTTGLTPRSRNAILCAGAHAALRPQHKHHALPCAGAA